jgi:hypothetical protein
MQIARAMKTRLPHDSRADLACGSIRPAFGSVAGAAAVVAGGVDDGTGRLVLVPSRCTGWPIGRCDEALLVVDGVPYGLP